MSRPGSAILRISLDPENIDEVTVMGSEKPGPREAFFEAAERTKSNNFFHVALLQKVNFSN